LEVKQKRTLQYTNYPTKITRLQQQSNSCKTIHWFSWQKPKSGWLDKLERLVWLARFFSGTRGWRLKIELHPNINNDRKERTKNCPFENVQQPIRCRTTEGNTNDISLSSGWPSRISYKRRRSQGVVPCWYEGFFRCGRPNFLLQKLIFENL